MAPPRSCQRRAAGSHSTRPRFLGTRRRPTTRRQDAEADARRKLQARVAAAATRQLRGPASEHDPVLAQRRDKNCRAPRSRLSSAASALARSHRTPQLYATVRYASSRYGTVLHGHVIDHMHLEEAIANTDSAKEIRRRAVMKNAARLVSKAVFCCKIYTRGRVSNDDLISTKGT
jgi:hypothetical protein